MKLHPLRYSQPPHGKFAFETEKIAEGKKKELLHLIKFLCGMLRNITELYYCFKNVAVFICLTLLKTHLRK